LTAFIIKAKARRTAGSTAERGLCHIIDCVKSATFISWLLYNQSVPGTHL